MAGRPRLFPTAAIFSAFPNEAVDAGNKAKTDTPDGCQRHAAFYYLHAITPFRDTP